ncbi:MAG: MBOAT family protein [Desulfovibrio sp.]|nr:MBOAT family protein [Desulfovibrio sp.]
MLFNSYTFLFAFLPLLLICWRLAAGYGTGALAMVLLVFSIAFYGFWGVPFLLLLAAMLGMNYGFALALVERSAAKDITSREKPEDLPQERVFFGLSRKGLLALALTLNLIPLVWFKYSVFLGQNLAALMHVSWEFAAPGLPLGISFYTFIQIAWLVSVYRGQVQPQGFTRHVLFSTCFPYVISGPIVRYEQMGAQLDVLGPCTAEGLARGFSLFTVGLVKKVVLADSLALYADAVFNSAEKAFPLSGCEAWLGSLCYTFQLYFDFSGYTDMAIGLGLMLGMRLPENFDSPYKSTGIVDFWRRWHITLSSWLRDYLYIPLGGNRKGKLKQYRNLFLTMLIGGAWHGAGWTFVVWGAIHGVMLGINHYFRARIRGTRLESAFRALPLRVCSIGFTFFCINLCWVVFRAVSIEGAGRMYRAMFAGPFTPEAAGILAPTDGLNALAAMGARWLPNGYLQGWLPFALLLASFVVVWFLPNSHEIFNGRRDGTRLCFLWRPSAAWATSLAILAFVSLILVSRKATFLYFQF